MTEELNRAEARGLLITEENPERLSSATRDMAVDLADRSARWAAEDTLPLEDGWANALEGEEVAIGPHVTRWIRERLPPSEPERTAHYHMLVQALRTQVAQECRHLRRLHMSLEHVYAMGIALPPNDSQATLSDDHLEESMDVKDMVDQIIMMMAQYQPRRQPSVMEMLQGVSEASTTSSGSADPPDLNLFTECESLRRWLNGVFEGSLSSLLEEQLQREDQLANQDTSEAVRDDEEADRESEVQAETGVDEDTTAMVQHPWKENESDAGRRSSRRPRSRSPDRTWSRATATGWTTGARPCSSRGPGVSDGSTGLALPVGRTGGTGCRLNRGPMWKLPSRT